MRTLWFALLFLLGGISHEVRKPSNCESLSTGQFTGPRKRDLK